MNIQWDSKVYAEKFDFVHQYGQGVLELLDRKEGMTAVDLGCGNGNLTAKLAEMGVRVIGLDDSADMIERARREYPQLIFRQANALTFQLENPVDAIFSNAVFHWIDGEKQDAMLRNLAGNLRPGGQLVTEFGGYGCAETIHAALAEEFAERGMVYPRTFYFPTIGEYAPKVEAAGMRVAFAALFDRWTEVKGEDGAADWIRMFVKQPFEGMDPQTKEEIIGAVVEKVREKLYVGGTWHVDYVRIRIKAVKASHPLKTKGKGERNGEEPRCCKVGRSIKRE